MAKLTVMDLLSFAKAGYTPKDVKELLSMDVPETKESTSVTQEPAKQEPASAEPMQEQKTEEPVLQNVSTATPENASAEVIDYKAKYTELEEKMKKLQEQNTRQDISKENVKDPMTGVDDFLKSIM